MQNARKLPERRHREQTPEQWVAEQLMFSDDDGSGVAKFRIEARNSERERFRAYVAVLRKSDDTPVSIYEKIDTQAARCKAPEVQVTAWLRRSTKQPVGIFNWPVEFESDEGEEKEHEESIDSALYRQLARHNETLMANFMRLSQSTMMHLAGQNERFEQEREKVSQERLETFEVYKRAEGDAHDRELKGMRWAKIGETLKTLGEAVAFRMTQGQVAPDAQSAVLLRSLHLLGQSITSEQAAAIQKILDANQLTLLTTLVSDPEGYAKQSIQPPPPAPEQTSPAAEAPASPPDPPSPAPEKPSRKTATARAKRKKVPRRKSGSK